MTVISVVVNGDANVIDANATLAAAIAPLVQSSAGVAVALDDSVIPRHLWDSTGLHDGARIEVLVAVQGG